jgi:hypothetical protein
VTWVRLEEQERLPALRKMKIMKKMEEPTQKKQKQRSIASEPYL